MASDHQRPTISKDNLGVGSMASDLRKLAIQYLDKYQWQLPLMEMDQKFRDRTYYKHYSDSYISSLRSKLGHFLADNQLISNPMRYHLKQELDNYEKYSKMFELLTEYYRSLGNGFFSFATPSPDEEIVIGCRLGTKGYNKDQHQNFKKLSAKDEQISARFQYNGKAVVRIQKTMTKDLTIREDFTAEQLATKCNDQNPTAPTPGNNSPRSSQPRQQQQQQPQQQYKQSTKPPVQPRLQMSKAEKDHEAFKLRSMQATKEYDEFIKSSRPRLNLVVVGHVDAGKSTLVGHLLYKLGCINGKQMHRYEVDSQRSGKASFKFAWALDETSEERARGVTIDIALTKFETPKKDVVLLDAPGHVDFIPAMISGAAQADAALLVVDATRGEFETGFSSGGQTREHTLLVRSLGVKSLIVVVNKMDNVDWDTFRFTDIVDQMKPFLKQVGFNVQEDVQFIAVSGLSGDNLLERRQDKLKKMSSHPQLESDDVWTSMPSLVEAIDKMRQPDRMVDKPTRVCVTDVFKGMSGGVFLGGKVAAGKVETKQKLVLLPPNEQCEVKSVEVRDGPNARAFAGDIITLVATGIDMNKYYRGCILCEPSYPCHVTNRFQARIIMFQDAQTILVKGTPIEVHINGAYECGLVRKLISLLDKRTGELIRKKPRCIAQNSSAIIQLRLDRVVCCELYEENKDLGRFMVRSFGKTIAAGLITKIRSAKLGRKGGTKMKSK